MLPAGKPATLARLLTFSLPLFPSALNVFEFLLAIPIGILADVCVGRIMNKQKRGKKNHRTKTTRGNVNVAITYDALVEEAAGKPFVSLSSENEQRLPIRRALLSHMTTPAPFRTFGIND